jgi:anthranilate phosphoribosyltransferase
LAGGAGRPALEAATAFNAGAALYIAGRASSIPEGARKAAAALSSGAVAAKIEELKAALSAPAPMPAGAGRG